LKVGTEDLDGGCRCIKPNTTDGDEVLNGHEYLSSYAARGVYMVAVKGVEPYSQVDRGRSHVARELDDLPDQRWCPMGGGFWGTIEG